ncbi:MAG: hypothetical protein ABIZ91_09785 [Gemmatimonadaceae bacterium]
MSISTLRASVLMSAVLLAASAMPMHAQQAAADRAAGNQVTAHVSSAATAVQAALPVPYASPAGISRTSSAEPLELPQRGDRVNMGPNLALMGVGAAAVVVGLLVGGDGGTIISLTGAVLGLIGLYRFLR